MNLTAIQTLSSPDVEKNFKHLETLLLNLPSARPQLVVLPECFVYFGGSDKRLLEIAQDQSSVDQIIKRMQQIAAHHNVWLVAGTMPILASDKQHFRASCLVIDDIGQIQARYDKIHLFDVSVDDATGSYQESRYTEPGNQVITVDSPFGKIGVAVCYDVRFPGLFQAMGAVDVVVLPSAFTQKTGLAHWHTLLRARSIELQTYVVGANQSGVHENGRETYGNSVIYSPWGEQLALIEKGTGVVTAPMDRTTIERIRQSMPVNQHKKFRSDFDKSG